MDDVSEFKKKIQKLKSHSTLVDNNLKMKCQNQQETFDELLKGLDDKSWDQCLKNVEELKDNSKHMIQLMEQQNEISQSTLSTTEEILKKLEDSYANKEVLRYRDWVTTLIEEINNKLIDMENVNGLVAWNVWNKISRAFKIKIEKNLVNFAQNDAPFIQTLKNILEEVDITLEDFELLMRLKLKSNVEFHIERSQTVEEAIEQFPDTTFPEDLQFFKEPLRKALNAVKIWRV